MYRDDIVICTEAVDYESKEGMQIELEADWFNLDRTLATFNLHVSPTKTEFLSVNGKRATNPNPIIDL